MARRKNPTDYHFETIQPSAGQLETANVGPGVSGSFAMEKNLTTQSY